MEAFEVPPLFRPPPQQQQEHQQQSTTSPEGPEDLPSPAADLLIAEEEPNQKRPRPSPTNEANNDDAPPGAGAGGGEEYRQLKRRRKIEPRGVPWFVMLDRLKQYRDRYGSLNVPSTFRQDPKLASWVQYQRYLYHHKEIASERKEALDAIGFSWSVLKPKTAGKRSSWDEQLARVAAYKEANGNTLIPYSYQEDPSLGFWVSKQRKDYKHGQLAEDKVAKLDAIGFIWKPPTGRRQGSKKKNDDDVGGGGNRQSSWERMFQKLREFHTIHGSEKGHSRSDLNAIDKQLATWIKTQRHMYTIKKMSQDRIEKLESIGFAWRVGQDWVDFFAILKHRVEKYGTCDLPESEDARLAAWMDSQRVAYKYRELSKERVESLKSIGFSFAIDEGLNALESSAPPVDWVPYGTARGGGAGHPTGPSPQGVATAPAQQTMPGQGGNATTNEYNIAIQLAGLAVDPQKAVQEGQAPGTAATEEGNDATKASVPEAGAIVLVDGAGGGGTIDEGTMKAALESQVALKEDGQPPNTTMGVLSEVDQSVKVGAGAVKHDATNMTLAAKPASEEDDDLDELTIQTEIVELQMEKVRLQAEKVSAQKEKLALLREVKELEAQVQQVQVQVQDQEMEYNKRIEAENDHNKQKNDLEERARANDELLVKQAAQIKDQEEKLVGLLKEMEGEETVVT